MFKKNKKNELIDEEFVDTTEETAMQSLDDTCKDASDDITKKKRKSKKEKSKKEKAVKEQKINIKQTFQGLTNKQKLGIIILAVSFSLMFVANPLIAYIGSTQTTLAVVSTRNIEKGSVISDSDITVVEVAKNSALAKTYLTKKDVIGKYALTNFLQGEALISSKVGASLPLNDSYVYTLENGEYALSITLNSLASSVSSKIKPLDIISIFSVSNNNDILESILYPELTYIKVLDITDSDGLTADNTTISTVTILVNEEQAKLLTSLEYNSTLHTALVSRGDNEKSEKLLKAQKELFENRKDFIGGDASE